MFRVLSTEKLCFELDYEPGEQRVSEREGMGNLKSKRKILQGSTLGMARVPCPHVRRGEKGYMGLGQGVIREGFPDEGTLIWFYN